jgi:hypothetical protein
MVVICCHGNVLLEVLFDYNQHGYLWSKAGKRNRKVTFLCIIDIEAGCSAVWCRVGIISQHRNIISLFLSARVTHLPACLIPTFDRVTCEFTNSCHSYALCISLAIVLSEVICFRAVAIVNLKGRKLWDLFKNSFPDSRIQNRLCSSYVLHSASFDLRVHSFQTPALHYV